MTKVVHENNGMKEQNIMNLKNRDIVHKYWFEDRHQLKCC